MATGRITKKAVEAVPVPASGKRAFLWDDQLKGFGVMVTERGVRSYVVQYRIGGRAAKTRRATIGGHGSPWTAEKARERAADLLEMVRKGIDPVETEKMRRGEEEAARHTAERLAFEDYADLFIKKHARARGLRSADDIEAIFKRDLKPYFKRKSIASLKRADIRACLDEIGERSGAAAQKAFAWLRKMLAWAVSRGDLATSPMDGMDPPHRSVSRERFLELPELANVWKGAEAQGDPFGAMTKLLILTGQRLREVAGMEWPELDLKSRLWAIPASRAKNGREHLVPLSATVVEMLKAMKKTAVKGCPFVLTTNRKAAVSGFSKAKRKLDELVEKARAREAEKAGEEAPAPLQQWVFHDLRRSFATGCQALGIPIEHTEAVLNHVSGKRGGIAAVYQRHDYLPEKRRALEAWERAVIQALNGDANVTNVVAIR